MRSDAPTAAPSAASTVTFAASRGKALLLLLSSVCFVAFGLWLRDENPFLGWVTIGFFGLGIPVGLLMMLPNASYLRLDEEGFEVRTMFRGQKLKWTDVGGFRVVSIRGSKMVAIIYGPEYQAVRLGRQVAAALTGAEGAIPNQFSASPERILEALTEFRSRYGGRLTS